MKKAVFLLILILLVSNVFAIAIIPEETSTNSTKINGVRDYRYSIKDNMYLASHWKNLYYNDYNITRYSPVVRKSFKTWYYTFEYGASLGIYFDEPLEYDIGGLLE